MSLEKKTGKDTQTHGEGHVKTPITTEAEIGVMLS